MKSLTITLPDENTDGSPFALASYKATEVRFDDGAPIRTNNTPNAQRVVTFDVSGILLPEGPHFVEARVIDTEDDASDWTPVVTFVNKVVPKAPKAIAVS